MIAFSLLAAVAAFMTFGRIEAGSGSMQNLAGSVTNPRAL
jgi:hypothetical protein